MISYWLEHDAPYTAKFMAKQVSIIYELGLLKAAGFTSINHQ
jgi:hypothetical protein